MRSQKALILLVLLTALFSNSCSFGQVYSNKIAGNKNTELADSLSKTEYPYVLPIWGKQATEKGFQLPYSAGIGVTYFWQESDMIIEDLEVGFNNGPKIGLDEIIRFNDAIATSNAVTFRPDIWLLPFLNIYGIIGKANTSTEISAGVWVPDSENNWSEIADFSSKAEFDATSFGFGMTPTMGVRGGWLALDMNVLWTDVSALDKPVFTFVFGPRLGKTFNFKNPERNIAVWAGGFRVKLSSQTNGSLDLVDVLPETGLQEKVDTGIENLEIKQMDVEDWWSNLTPAQQLNPVNAAKYSAANRAFEAAGKLLNGIDGALSNVESSTVQYSLNKRPADKWNFIVGSQFQLNKHWMIRAEYGFLSSRQQFLTGLQYRFGL